MNSPEVRAAARRRQRPTVIAGSADLDAQSRHLRRTKAATRELSERTRYETERRDLGRVGVVPACEGLNRASDALVRRQRRVQPGRARRGGGGRGDLHVLDLEAYELAALRSWADFEDEEPDTGPEEKFCIQDLQRILDAARSMPPPFEKDDNTKFWEGVLAQACADNDAFFHAREGRAQGFRCACDICNEGGGK